MNISALTIGIIIAVCIVIRFRKTRLERTRWAYPLFVASFPLYYFAFALFSNEVNILIYEIIAGSVFFCIAYCAYQSKQTQLYLVAGMGCILHAFYDYYHDALFTNHGTPGWWIEFCGVIDLILGIYLILLMTSEHNTLLARGYEKT